MKFTREWARDHGIDNYYESEGPCHQVMVEHGHVLPGAVVLGTDSHTCMGGALGAFATGVGSTEMLGVLLTGKTWLRVPETIQVKWSGKLPDGVMAKDIALKTIGAIGHAGATYKAVEFAGCAIDALSLDQRLAITNMAVEMGAKVGLMSPDAKVVEYLESQNISSGYSLVFSDPDATYCARYEFCADELVPVVACPHEVDNVSAVSDVQGVDIDQAYLGSCTGGRYEDLRGGGAPAEGAQGGQERQATGVAEFSFHLETGQRRRNSRDSIRRRRGDSAADLRRLRRSALGFTGGRRNLHLFDKSQLRRQDGQPEGQHLPGIAHDGRSQRHRWSD